MRGKIIHKLNLERLVQNNEFDNALTRNTLMKRLIDLYTEKYGIKKSSYYAKVEHYKKVHFEYKKFRKNNVASFEVLPSSVNCFFLSGVNYDQRKKELLQKLITLSHSLSEYYDKDIELCFFATELEFSKFINPRDRLLVLEKSLLSDEAKLIESYFKRLAKFLLSLLPKIFTRFPRDLREFIRRIVHFFFTGVSDECDARIFLFDKWIKQKILTHQFINNETLSYSSATKKHT